MDITPEEARVVQKVEHYLRGIDYHNIVGMLSGGISNDLRFAGVDQKVSAKLSHRLVALIDVQYLEGTRQKLHDLSNNQALLLDLVRASMTA
jgi:uncharacterized transporter YbjL